MPHRPSPFKSVGRAPAYTPRAPSSSAAVSDDPLSQILGGIAQGLEAFTDAYMQRTGREREEKLQEEHEKKREQRVVERKAIEERGSVEDLYSILGPMSVEDPSLFAPGLDTSEMGSRQLENLLRGAQTQATEKRAAGRESARDVREGEQEEARNAREKREELEREARHEKRLRERPLTAAEERKEAEQKLEDDVYMQFSQEPDFFTKYSDEARADWIKTGKAYARRGEKFHFDPESRGIKKGVKPPNYAGVVETEADTSAPAQARSWIDMLLGRNKPPATEQEMALPGVPPMPGAPPAPGVSPQGWKIERRQ